MSKSKTDRWYDDYDEYNVNRHERSAREHRRQKNLTNILRSKNIDLLLELEDDESEKT